MASEVFKFIAGGTVVVIVGIVIVALSEQSPEEKMSESYLRSVSLSPSDSSGDGQTRAIIIWKIDQQGISKTIVCRYEKEKGVAQLSMDGEMISLK